MLRVITLAMIVFVPSCFACGTAGAQDFRVYTTIQDLSAVSASEAAHAAAKAPIVSRSLTLFHAGKAYDSIAEIGEVIVIDFDSDKRHYSLLNTRREITTSAHFDEVKQLLQFETQVADESIRRQENSTDPKICEAVALHRFERAPKFEEVFDAPSRRLSLSSAFVRYNVTCAEPVQPEFIEAYCRYADAISRLNYVVHPGILLPEPRLKLNDALRRHGVLPTEVQLDINTSQPVSLLARHQFRWKLDRRDRGLIDHWESMIASQATRRLTLQQYQQQVVGAAAKERR